MRRLIVLSVLVLIAAHAESLYAAPVAQSQFVQAGPSGPMRDLQQRTKENWTQMKRRFSLQREKYAACRKEARSQRLKGQKTRAFLKQCMSR